MSIPDTNGVEVSVQTNNTLLRNLGKLVLSKQLSGGPGVETYNGPFEINYDCGVGYTGFDSGSRRWVARRRNDPGIPTGSDVHGLRAGVDGDPTGYRVDTPTFSPESVGHRVHDGHRVDPGH